MQFLTKKIVFPDVSKATSDGLLAIGGDLSPERLISAYQRGIFPWFNEGEPILWWSPDPRFVLFPEALKVSKSMQQLFARESFSVTVNKDFRSVITACANARRKQQAGTWITMDMIDAYVTLHNMGLAKSVEVWHDGLLAGGLYGVDMGNGVFSGESMFSSVNNASKYGFITFVKNSDYRLIDCQVHTPHLESLGACKIPRNDFLKILGN
ncbi:MAG TPA: leucyl/phenylalanyl-tRNA--protein transferase [Aquaticitalea sp.]|nr:leucyl/phenylalanyl-tRNA--protein transferase [Aquaticitalea sp.]